MGKKIFLKALGTVLGIKLGYRQLLKSLESTLIYEKYIN